MKILFAILATLLFCSSFSIAQSNQMEMVIKSLENELPTRITINRVGVSLFCFNM